MLCELLTVGGQFRVIAKNPTQYKAIARLMQSAFPGVPMSGTISLDKNIQSVLLKTEKGLFALSFQGAYFNTEMIIPETDNDETV